MTKLDLLNTHCAAVLIFWKKLIVTSNVVFKFTLRKGYFFWQKKNFLCLFQIFPLKPSLKFFIPIQRNVVKYPFLNTRLQAYHNFSLTNFVINSQMNFFSFYWKIHYASFAWTIYFFWNFIIFFYINATKIKFYRSLTVSKKITTRSQLQKLL